MQMRLVAIFFVIAVSIGWLMPGFTPEVSEAAKPGAEERAGADIQDDWGEEDEEGEDDDDGWLSSEVTLDREPDGHFYAEVEVNGQTVNFLVDTGATAVALTAEDAEALGLYWDEDNLQKVGRGVSGDVYGKLVTIDNMQLGSLSASNIRAAIIPHGLDRSLLGQAFLKKVDNVNISGDQMVLK